MPYTQPGRGDVHVNRPLTNLSVAFMQRMENFIAARVFPNIPVEKKSDEYFTYDRGEFNRDEMQERAPGAPSAGGDYTISTADYSARVYAYHRDIADQQRGNLDQPLNLDREATEFITLKGLIKRERLWVDSFFKGGVWTFDIDGGASRSASFSPTVAASNDLQHWSDSNSTPIEDIRLIKRYILENTGFMPNTLVLGRPVFDALLDHSDIVGRLDRGQTTGPVVVMRENLAALFELENVLVMDAIHNTADEGLTASHSFIGGKHALLCYAAPSPGIMTPTAGYTFSWTGYAGASDNGVRFKRFRMEELAGDRVEGEMAFVQKRISSDLGAFFEGIVV